MPQGAAGNPTMQIEAIGMFVRVLIQHRNDIGLAILLEADMRDIALRKELPCALGNRTLGMLTNDNVPSAVGDSVAHAINLAEHKKIRHEKEGPVPEGRAQLRCAVGPNRWRRDSECARVRARRSTDTRPGSDGRRGPDQPRSSAPGP